MFDGDLPLSARPEFTAGFQQKIGEATTFKCLRYVIDGPALGDAGQIQFQGRMLLLNHAIWELELLPSDSRARGVDGRVRGRKIRVGIRAKSPEPDQRPNS